MIEIKLPSLGADMDQGTLLEWRVKPGDEVRKGDVIAVVDTSKAAIDVENWHAGTVLELAVAPGDKVPVGESIAFLVEPGESAEVAREKMAASRVAAVRPPSAPVVAAAGMSPKRPTTAAASLRVSPAARRRAADLQIDLAGLAGTGPDGAITIEDVEHAAAAKRAGGVSPTPVDRYREMRRTIAQAMARSKREIPHYYMIEDVALGRTLDWLHAENEKRPVAERLLVAALYIKATALAAAKYPEMNGFFVDGDFNAAPHVHVGVAISLRQGGLIAPAIHDVDQKSIGDVMRDLSDLVRRTRAGSLRSSELSDPTITLTNLGEQSVTALYPVINPPQVAIIGIGKVGERPWVASGQIQIERVVTVSLAADHRVSDGHRGALFLADIRESLQQPGRL